MSEMIAATNSVTESAVVPTVAPVTDPQTEETALSPALIRAVADKVYALWLAELKIARERTGVFPSLSHHRQGGSSWR